MNKKILIILVLIIGLFAIGFVGYNLIFNGNTGDNNGGEVGETNFYGEFPNPNQNNNLNNGGDGDDPNNSLEVITIYDYEDVFNGGPQPKLIRVSSMPVAGYGMFMKERFEEVPIISPEDVGINIENGFSAPKKEKVPAVRYVAKSNGNIYQTFLDKIDERKFTQTIIPGVRKPYFNIKGDGVVFRYLQGDGETINTFLGSLPEEILAGDSTSTYEIKGSFLPENVVDLSVSPSSSKIFYLLMLNDSVAGVTANFLGDKKSQIFDSPFTEWLTQWGYDNMITITTKAGKNQPGFVYSIDPTNRTIRKILGGVDGLTTLLSPNGDRILYGDDNLSLYVYDIESKERNLLGVRTLPEKCAWHGGGEVVYCMVPVSTNFSNNYPDSWYQGEVSFLDEIWRINTTTGSATKILDPLSVEGGAGIDGIKLYVDDGNDYLFFVNKKDSYLWMLDLR